jgi:2-desacetyl-2-hydroxyethyl bacteriochlorophyllide A dehydrogenase
VRAVVAREGALHVEAVDEPAPGPGQVLVRPVATGICGSDLHALDAQGEDPEALPPMVFGHEFCAEVLDHGPGSNRHVPVGALVCSVPFVEGAEGPELVGLTPNFPGGFSERMLLQQHRLLVVPNGLAATSAAVTEPLAVGVHAVVAAGLTNEDVPLVLGCGPIGLAVIAALRVAGHHPIVAADFSPARRALAEQAGADVVVDPASSGVYDEWLGLSGPPLPPSPLLAPSDPAATTVVFDCVGASGLLAQHIEAVPSHSRLVVVGVCATLDSFVPVRAIEKELTIQFVFAYRPAEFATALRLIADGMVDVTPWITGTCDLDGVPHAFDDLRSPEVHCKILVTPGAVGTTEEGTA